uniref:Putative secreted protein n=1 Tax=Ixodes ricinus TaxID=34613 RepID=A0A6B0U6H8_IXORI
MAVVSSLLPSFSLAPSALSSLYFTFLLSAPSSPHPLAKLSQYMALGHPNLSLKKTRKRILKQIKLSAKSTWWMLLKPRS